MNEHWEIDTLTRDGEQKSSFSATLIAKAVGDTAQGIGNIAQASAKKKEAEAKIKEIGGKRQAQLKDCEDSKEYKKFLDPKKTKNAIKGCKEEVRKRMDAEENEQKEIVRRMASIEESKIASDLEKEKSNVDEKKSSKKLYVYGGIVALVLVLGTIIYLKSAKK